MGYTIFMNIAAKKFARLQNPSSYLICWLREQGIFLYENCAPFLFSVREYAPENYQRSSIPDGSKIVCFLSPEFFTLFKTPLVGRIQNC